MESRDEKALTRLLDGILSKNDSTRFGCFEALLSISEKRPESLYPKWDYFVDLLGSDNNYSKYIAIYLLANLTRVDSQGRFEKIFDKYYDILFGERIMTASHVAINSGKIAKNKPNLSGKITERLLNIDRISRSSQKELLKGYIIEAFDLCFKESKEKKRIMEFVRRQLKSKSPRTKKTAEKFLVKWEKDL